MSLKEIFKSRKIPLSARVENPKIQAFFLDGTSFQPETEKEFLYLGCHYRSLGQWDQMIEHYQRAGGRGYHYLALHYSETKNHPAMMAAYQKAIDLGYVQAMINLGLHHKQLNNQRSARRLFLQALQLDNPSAAFCLGRMAFEAQQYVQMEEYYRRCLAHPRVTPKEEIGIWFSYGDYYIHLKQYDRAVTAYQHILSFPLDVQKIFQWEVHLGLAQCYAYLRQNQLAVTHFSRAAYYIIRDRGARALSRIGQVAEQVGKPNLAISFYVGSMSQGSMVGRLALLRLLIQRKVEPVEFLESTQLEPGRSMEEQREVDQVTGDYYRQRQEYDQMEVYYRRADNREALIRHYVAMDQLDRAESYLDELLNQDNPNLYDLIPFLYFSNQSSWINRCLDKLITSTDLVQLRKSTSSLIFYTKNHLFYLLQRRLDLGDTQVYLDLAYYGNRAEAEGYLQLALEAGHDDAHLRLARSYFQSNQFELAEQHYRAALAAQLTEAHLDLGDMYRKMGRTEESLTCYRQAISHGYPCGYARLVDYYAQEGQLDKAEALGVKFWREFPAVGSMCLKRFYHRYPSESGLRFARRLANEFLFCEIFCSLLPRITLDLVHLSLWPAMCPEPLDEMKTYRRLDSRPEARRLREIYVADLAHHLVTSQTYLRYTVKDVREIIWDYLTRTCQSKRIGPTTIQALLVETKEEPFMYPSYLRDYFRIHPTWISLLPGDLQKMIEKYLRGIQTPSRPPRQVCHRFDSENESF